MPGLSIYSHVTSLVEVWIEIFEGAKIEGKRKVTSLVEVWIEISAYIYGTASPRSLPLWKCGLKLQNEGG